MKRQHRIIARRLARAIDATPAIDAKSTEERDVMARMAKVIAALVDTEQKLAAAGHRPAIVRDGLAAAIAMAIGRHPREWQEGFVAFLALLVSSRDMEDGS